MKREKEVQVLFGVDRERSKASSQSRAEATRLMKITLPLPPNMANSRFHWRVKHNKRKAYFEACDFMHTVIATANRPPKAKIRATIYCGGTMDTDNALARLKWPVDWMVGVGILSGDKPSQLEWHWPIEQVVKRNQQYRVEFELEAA